LASAFFAVVAALVIAFGRPRRRSRYRSSAASSIAALFAAPILAIAISQGLAIAARADDGRKPGPTGRWVTPGVGSIVELAFCDAAGAPGTLCGRIVWIWNALDDSGSPRRDRENPDSRLRERPLAGMEILQGFRESSAGVWAGGAVYNPDDGRTYSGSVRLRADGTMALEGCALRVFCQTQIWRRPDEILARLKE
jgi:uncharacterized protein (DUF2147 family)